MGPRDQVRVMLRDGLFLEPAQGDPVRCDPGSQLGGRTVVSHAHGDHLPSSGGQAVTSNLTARLASTRRNDLTIAPTQWPEIELFPAGHVAGSRVARIAAGDTSILYTGDVCTRERDYLPAFDPPAADILIMEATYGQPEYCFPPVPTVTDRAIEWLQTHSDSPAIVFGYALGKAQRILRMIGCNCGRRVLTTDAVLRINEVISDVKDVDFGALKFSSDMDLGAGDLLVLPSQLAGTGWVEELIADVNAVTAGFSGWAIDDSYRFRHGLDRGFALSDHCDFEELLALAKAVDPEIVYTLHGFAEDLARHLTHEGFQTRALEAGQSTFADFQ